MKFFILLSLLTVMSFKTFAQQDDKLFYLSKSEKYRKMKNAGGFLTVTGGILFVVGIVTLSNVSETTTYNNGTTTQTNVDGNVGAGVAEFLLGTAGLGAGIPLWIVGAHNEKKYNRKLESISLKINSTPQLKGLTLCYRF